MFFMFEFWERLSPRVCFLEEVFLLGSWLPLRVLVFLPRDNFLNESSFWWKPFCWGSDYLFNFWYSCWGTLLLMSLPSGGGFSIWLPITCLSFTLPVDGHVLNETPCWGEPVCRFWLPVWVLVFLLRDFFLMRLLSGVRLDVRIFWWKSFCWGSDYLFDFWYSCWGTFFLTSLLSVGSLSVGNLSLPAEKLFLKRTTFWGEAFC